VHRQHGSRHRICADRRRAVRSTAAGRHGARREPPALAAAAEKGMLIMIATLMLLSAIAADPGAPGPGRPGRALQRLASEARTADLRGGWTALLRAHDGLSA